MTDTRDLYKLVRELENQHQVNDTIGLYDSFDLELNEHFVIESGVVGLTEDGVIIQLDEAGLEFLDFNGMINESEELDEKMIMGADSDAASAGSKTLGEKWDDDYEGTVPTEEIEDMIKSRILRMTPVIMKYGPVRIMAAIQDYAAGVQWPRGQGINSKDPAHWAYRVVRDLEKGYYDSADSVPVRKEIEVEVPDWIREDQVEEAARINVDDIFNEIVKSDDPFELVYNGLSGDHGEEVRQKLQDMYDDISIDDGLHPDDDFEKIIDRMIDHIEGDYGEGGSQKPYWTVGGNKELDEIKRLALGREDDLEEGWGKNLLIGAALISSIAGINKMHANHLMKTEPQLITLTQMRQEAEQRGDEAAVKDLDDRIKKTLDFISIEGRPVMGPDGKPVDPRKPLGEAEYQGRKVPLGKPMQGDVKKSKVYVKKPNGKVVKVNFGDKNMKIKKSNPKRRKSFRARHNCENPGPRWKARYWSCRAW